MNRRQPSPLIVIVSTALAIMAAPATTALTYDRLQLHGFLAQAAFHTSDNNFYGQSDDGVSTDANEAGLNAALRLSDNLRLSGQVIARNGGESDPGELRTDLFNLDWQFWKSMQSRAGVRVGRVRNPYGLYNETRDVASARPSI